MQEKDDDSITGLLIPPDMYPKDDPSKYYSIKPVLIIGS